jgi:4-amino-4-deoxy-L-arabinose transferase-like glycosyltransferase
LSRSWLIVPLLILYLLDLGGVGFLGPDEPRYASIGREMARSHDFVTPRLDGSAWFEKPPLLYWMIAAGRLAQLPDEWAARLPVTLASIGFLVFFFLIVLREFSPRTAIAASTILATSAGWLAFSFVAVTDLPMSAALAAAMLIAMYETRREYGYIAGALLGLAVLAKGFVPLVLFAPVLLIARGRRLTTIAACIATAAPWYVLVWFRNGSSFWHEFFWKHHVERFFTPSLQHVQPYWFYIPVILAGLFPWTPLAGLLFRPKLFSDVRIRVLGGWLLFAVLFFSIARNKLPGYVLPLLPALAIVLAIAIEKLPATAARWWLTASAVLLVALPVIVAALPEALLSGVRRAPVVLTPGVPFLLIAPLVWWLTRREKATLGILVIGLAVMFGLAYVKGKVFPVLDSRVSVRQFFESNRGAVAGACLDESIRRDWEYGLNYYADRPLPHCEAGQVPRISSVNGRLVFVQ